MLYILERFFEESACYSVPIGGTCEMGNTLVRGLEKFGGKIQLNAHVDEIMVENGRAVGVRLKNGNVVKAKKAVVSNATPFDTVKMLGTKQELPEGVAKWREDLGKLPRHGAIMHLFIAIDAEGLDLSHIEDPAHLVVQVSMIYWDGFSSRLAALCFSRLVFQYFFRIGTAPSKTLKTCAVSLFLACSTKPFVLKASTLFMFTRLVASRMSHGKSFNPDQKNMKNTRKRELKCCGVQLSSASPTFVRELSSISSALLWPTKRSFVATVVLMEWPGLLEPLPLMPVFLRTFFLSHSLI
jgi:hypothetical protein